MAATFATVPQRRPVHRRGFLSGHWLMPPKDIAQTASPGSTPAILIQARPDRIAEISQRLQDLGFGAIARSGAPSRLSVTLAGGLTVAEALSAVAGIPGVLAATLAGPSLSEAGA